MKEKSVYIPVLEFLQRQLQGTLDETMTTHMNYPTAISRLLGISIVDVGEATATLALDADPALHGNQQGTVHGGLLCELADAAIGTAHSTLMKKDESFTTIDIKTSFVRPVWRSRLLATAQAEHRGKTISHYRCEISRDDGKVVAITTSTVLTLTGEKARGR